MHGLAQIDAQKFVLFTLVLARTSGLAIAAPLYGSSEVPAQIRALLAFALALLIAPIQWDASPVHPQGALDYLLLVGSELAVGLSLGLGIEILFSGILLAGQLIGRIGGLYLADVFDPATEASIPMFSRFLYLVSLAVFLAMGGHRMVMAGLLDTFDALPPGSCAMPTSFAQTLLVVLAQSFALGIRASAPAVTALLLSTLVMGLISRTLPQLNILVVGFGMNSMLTFGVLALTLGAGAWVFQEQIEPVLETLLEALCAPLPATS
jgi:flagellar biosynthetic protein FliR